MNLITPDNIINIKIHNNAVAASTSATAIVEASHKIPLILPSQTHSCNVAIVDNAGHHSYPDTDALITQLKNAAIGIRTADCVPILIYANDIKTVAAVHAGWKGTLGKIIVNTIHKLRQLGGSPENFFVAFAPAICHVCYETDFSLAEKFKEAGFNKHIYLNSFIDPLTNKPFLSDKPHIDLIGCNCQLLTQNGIPAENINRNSLCTRHHSINGKFILHSYRRQNKTPERNISFIYIPK